MSFFRSLQRARYGETAFRRRQQRSGAPVASFWSLVDQTEENPQPPEAPKSGKDDQRLGDVVWKPEQEFPGRSTIDQHAMTLSRELQVMRRIARVSVRGIVQPARLALLGVCSSAVLGLSAYEAHLLIDPMHATSTLDTARFMYEYATQNFLASCIWETRPPELVAQALGLDPSQLLHKLDPGTSRDDAVLELRVMSVFTARSMVAGFMVVTQLLTIMRASGQAAMGYLSNVFDGREPPLQGINERIIRLAGSGSDVTEVSMARYGAHILPVFEDPAQQRHLVAQWSLNGRVPCVWRVTKGQYGYRHAWAALDVDASFLLRTTTGKYILCIEADATRMDCAFELRSPAKTPQNEELSVEDASQAYRLVERQASLALQRPFRSLCVFLGDSRQSCDLGGEAFVTLRERTKLKREVHVLIDAKAPLLLEILKWCSRFVDAQRKTLVLDVTRNNFAPLRLLLERNGYTVLTPVEAVEYEERERAEAEAKAKESAEAEEEERRRRQERGEQETMEISEDVDESSEQETKEKGAYSSKPAKLPHLLYYPTTAATINAVHATLTAGGSLTDPRHCCVLINQPFGLEHLAELADHAGQEFYPVCAAEVYDDYFRQVRIWTRMGHSATDIQRELDQRFEPVREVLDAIAALDQEAGSAAVAQQTT